MRHPAVLDASVGVKLFRNESGSLEARDLLASHGTGEITLCVPTLFLFEFGGVSRRLLRVREARNLWDAVMTWRLGVYELSPALAQESWNQCESIGCSFYDAVSPALATLLNAPLYSADRRAHSRYPDVVLIG